MTGIMVKRRDYTAPMVVVTPERARAILKELRDQNGSLYTSDVDKSSMTAGENNYIRDQWLNHRPGTYSYMSTLMSIAGEDSRK